MTMMTSVTVVSVVTVSQDDDDDVTVVSVVTVSQDDDDDVTVVSVVSCLLLVLLGHVTARTTAGHHQLCEAGQFQCRESSACISQNWLCDHYEDCPLGEDEYNCECSSDEFMCTDTECVPRDWRCDGDEDCHDGSDEDSRCNTYVRPDDDDDEVDAQPRHHGHGSHSGHQHFRHMPRKQLS